MLHNLYQSTEFNTSSVSFPSVGNYNHATEYHSICPEKPVILIRDEENESSHPISIPKLLDITANKYPTAIALCSKTIQGKWNKINYKQYHRQIITCAKAFMFLGLEPHFGVYIICSNSPEWVISTLAAICAGGISVGNYISNTIESYKQIANASKANIIVVEEEYQTNLILGIQSQLKYLKRIIQIKGNPNLTDVYSWDAMMQIGEEISNKTLLLTMYRIGENECATYIFTSDQNAIMLSHDNLIWNARSIKNELKLKNCSERILSYLPLGMAIVQVFDIYCPLMTASAVYFSNKNVLLYGTYFPEILKLIRPTRFLALPYVWNTIYELMLSVGNTKKKKVCLKYYMDKIEYRIGGAKPSLIAKLKYMICHHLLQRNKNKIGFGACKSFLSTAASLSPMIKKYFMSIDMPIIEMYGLAQSCGLHSICTLDELDLVKVGRALPGARTVLSNMDENGIGSICIYGRHVFMGYLNNQQKTDEAIDADGWLRTGDVGTIDYSGYLIINGKIDDSIQLGDDLISPTALEHNIKSVLPQVSNCMVLLNDRKIYLIALLTLKSKVNHRTSEPLDSLTKDTMDWLDGIYCSAATVTEVLKNGPDPELLRHIQNKINLANEGKTKHECIRKFVILPKDFSVPDGDYSPTMKILRPRIAIKYKDIISSLQ